MEEDLGIDYDELFELLGSELEILGEDDDDE
jgi:hypothetical protein